MIRLALACLVSGVLFHAVPATAEDSVTVNGMTFTCTNQCVVTTDPATGNVSVRDCCGGRVRGTFLPAPHDP